LVNTLYGQLRNEVICPKCGMTSIVFDPFTFLQLPLPVDNLREIPFTFVPADSNIVPRKLVVKLSAVEFIRTFKIKVAEVVQVELANLKFYEVFKSKWYVPLTRFNDLESIRGLKENESFFVYEVEPLSEEEKAIAAKREEELKKDYEVGEIVLAEGNDLKIYRAEIVGIRKASPNFLDQNEKPETFYTLQFKTQKHEYHFGTKRMQKLVRNPPKIDVCIKHLRESQYISKLEAFGMPQHLHFPTRQLTNHEVLQLVREKITMYVSDDQAYTVHWRVAGMVDNTVELLDNDQPFPLSQFMHMGTVDTLLEHYVTVPEIYVQWSDSNGYKNLVETEVHSLERQESAKVNTLSIHACLKHFCETEILDDMNMVYCRCCKKHQNSSKTTTIWKLPDHLLVHFKRFSYGGDFADKVKTPVSFPLTGLDLSKYLVNEEDQENCIYDLYGVSNHSGFLAGGHYTAYVKSLTNGKWYEMDDTDVTEIRDLTRISSKRAYLVFYRRRKKGEGAPLSPPLVDNDANENVEENEVDVVTAQPMSGEAGTTTTPIE